MRTTHSRDAATAIADRPPAVRLRVKVYDALASQRGLRKVIDQAARHGVSRSTMFRLRAGEQPGLDVAMRMAADLETNVEAIFERVPATPAV